MEELFQFYYTFYTTTYPYNETLSSSLATALAYNRSIYEATGGTPCVVNPIAGGTFILFYVCTFMFILLFVSL